MLNKILSPVPLHIQHKAGDAYRFLREFFDVPLDFMYDFLIYCRWSGTFNIARTKKTLQAFIIRMYHGIEVGLSYPEPRAGFGLKTINRLINALEKYDVKYGLDRSCKLALNVLLLYIDFNKQHNVVNEQLNNRVNRLLNKIPENIRNESNGGVIHLKRNDVFNPEKTDLASVIENRHSFREYLHEPVPMDIIQKAVTMAMRSPSACNRQQVRVHVLDDIKVRDNVLQVQNNQRGWRDQPDKLLLVTSSVEYYRQGRERYSAWIDGGLFAMTLVYALQSLGIGTCCLNLNLSKNEIKKLKKAAGLEKSDVMIMLIAAGIVPEEFNVAESTRRELDEVLRVIH